MNPLVSVVRANFNGERHLVAALRSVLAQSFTALELLLIDDASTDGSVALARTVAAGDPRLLVHRMAANRGPGAARNLGLALARGRWVAIVDADDLLHPDRLRRLIARAEADQADLIADDQMLFHDDGRQAPQRLLHGRLAAGASWIGPVQYALANRLFTRAPMLGYLKPLIRTAFLRAQAIDYSERMPIAEDFDFVLRLLARGAQFRLLPEILYFYRRHAASVSHRLTPSALQEMLRADASFRDWAGTALTPSLRVALDKRLASIHVAGAAETAIAEAKAGRPLGVLRALAAQPAAGAIVARLLTPARLVRRLRRAPPPMPVARAPQVCVLTRQRLVAGSSGSSAYLLSLCAALREAGFALRLVCPSPAVLGRRPVLRVVGDGSLFDSVAIRGTVRVGGVFLARDPMVYLRAALGIADRLARRVGSTALSTLARPAPYAVGLPWTAADALFVAEATRGAGDVVLADYGFLTPGIPYALRPGGRSAVLMHDLFSSRPAEFARLGAQDSTVALAPRAEAELLAGADLVIAIQAEEAEAARRMLPAGHAVVVAPMAARPVAAAQPGEGAGLLFVGSGAAANLDAMRWFLAAVWPLIHTARPATRLVVAGEVCTALTYPAPPPGVVLLGRVADLAPLYRGADVVIAPLRAGSGLKIKLVEALAHGKAVVATGTALQGVAELLADAVRCADTAEDFAADVLDLLAAPAARGALAARALRAAGAHFSTATAYAAVIDALRTPAPQEAAA
jgi:succinoglycan biosynthesis protein ExoO